MNGQYEARLERLRMLVEREAGLLRLLSEAKTQAAVDHTCASLEWCRKEIRSCNDVLAVQGT